MQVSVFSSKFLRKSPPAAGTFLRRLRTGAGTVRR